MTEVGPTQGPDARTPPEDPPPPTAPPRSRRITETMEELTAIVGRLEKAHRPAEDSDDRLSQVEEAVKWASPWRQLIGFGAVLAVGVVSVVTALSTYAKDAVVETVKKAHKAEDSPIEPSVATVDAIKDDVGSVKQGVTDLLKEDNRRKQVKAVEVELEQHDEQYQLKLQDYSAKKARGREPDMPTKSDRHIELEAQRKKILTQKL